MLGGRRQRKHGDCNWRDADHYLHRWDAIPAVTKGTITKKRVLFMAAWYSAPPARTPGIVVDCANQASVGNISAQFATLSLVQVGTLTVHEQEADVDVHHCVHSSPRWTIPGCSVVPKSSSIVIAIGSIPEPSRGLYPDRAPC